LDGLGCRLEVLDPSLGVVMHDRILDSHPGDRGVPAVGEQGSALVEQLPHDDEALITIRGSPLVGVSPGRAVGGWLVEPTDTRVAQAGTRWVHDGEIPTIVENIPDVSDDMSVRPVL
jgi:hypothetical protein